MREKTMGPVEWRDFGNGYQLVTRHGGAQCVLSVCDEKICVCVDGILRDLDPEKHAEARLIRDAYNSYRSHCVDPVEAAEGDLLGECVGLLRGCDEVIQMAYGNADDVHHEHEGEFAAVATLRNRIAAALAKCKGGE